LRRWSEHLIERSRQRKKIVPLGWGNPHDRVKSTARHFIGFPRRMHSPLRWRSNEIPAFAPCFDNCLGASSPIYLSFAASELMIALNAIAEVGQVMSLRRPLAIPVPDTR